MGVSDDGSKVLARAESVVTADEVSGGVRGLLGDAASPAPPPPVG